MHIEEREEGNRGGERERVSQREGGLGGREKKGERGREGREGERDIRKKQSKNSNHMVRNWRFSKSETYFISKKNLFSYNHSNKYFWYLFLLFSSLHINFSMRVQFVSL